MARAIIITGFLLMSLGAMGQYTYPGIYNPFPVYLWEQELYRREVGQLSKIEAECLSIKEAWERSKPNDKIENGVYEIYGVSEGNDDWRKVEVVVINKKIKQVGAQQITDSSKISKCRAKGTIAYKDGPSSTWYFFFMN